MKATWLQGRKQKRESKEAVALDLRKQIDELRAQLSRYAEAVEEDLNSGRQKVADKSRLGLDYEKRFQESSEVLIANLRARPEVRDLLVEIGEAQPVLSAKKDKAAE
jgi:serine/threonine-protein kinase